MAVKPKGLLLDITLCIGCNACSENCKTVNNLPPEIDDTLTADTWTIVHKKPDNGLYVRNLCRHCLNPACVSVCPVSALTKTEEGPVVYDKDKCLGCRYCMIGCPFRVPRFEWKTDDPPYSPRIRKCILCAPRLKEGKSTGCAEACPTEATVFGDRDELIEMAKARINAGGARYHKHIFGIAEAGGTSVLCISPIPFEDLPCDISVGEYPLPDLTWRVLMHVPNVVLLGAGFLGGSYWLFRRRAAVAKAEEEIRAIRPVKKDKERDNE